MTEGGWTERAYADADAYLAHRARAVARVGPLLEVGDVVLDLACGDGAFGEHLPPGVRYLGVDGSAEMVGEARARGHDAVLADLNDYVPPEPVAVTTCFRAIYYARDRRRFFAHAAEYTQKKLVFDLNPRQYDLEAVLTDLRAAGFSRIDTRPFFSPQRVALPAPVAAGLRGLEDVKPIARLLLRRRFTYVCAASR